VLSYKFLASSFELSVGKFTTVFNSSVLTSDTILATRYSLLATHKHPNCWTTVNNRYTSLQINKLDVTT